MIAEIAWDDKLKTGIHIIDSQHRNLLSKINAFFTAIDKGGGSTEARQASNYLEKYIASHFGLEEKYMREHRYPEQDFHIIQHKEFTKKFSDVRKALVSGPIHESNIKDLQYELWEYFKVHIQVVDTALATFLRGKI